jgi:hypothetical protein
MNYKIFIIFSVSILVLFGRGVSLKAAALESLIPKQGVPEGWALIEGPRTYTKKTLFEHINGQAELFFKYGYQKSIFGIYQNLRNPKNQIELDIYDMGNVLQAFGIFSRFRNEDRPGGFGLDSYLDHYSVFFYKGKYFVMLYAPESNLPALKQMSILISLKILDRSPPPKEIGYFPKEGLKPGSIQYFSEGLLGHHFLKRGFEGTYIEKSEVKAAAEGKVEAGVKDEIKDKAKTEGKEFHLFLAILKSSQEATSGLKVFKEYLSKRGKIHLGIPNYLGFNGLRGEDPYQGKVIVIQKGFYLLGVVGYEKEEVSENLLAEFVKNVR